MKNSRAVDISFIIPVFNGESKISGMLQSIFRMPEPVAYEIIVINDGSTDQTEKVLEELSKERDTLRFYSIPNSGQSRARNLGMEHAKGEYLFFADADDCVMAENIAELLFTAREGSYEIVSGTYVREEPGKEAYLACEGIPDGMISRKEDTGLFSIFKTQSAFGYIWNKLYRRQFLLKNRISFDDTIPAYMEDQLFNLKAVACDAAYYFRNVPVYEYHFQGASTTRRADPLIAEKSIAMLESYEEYLKEKDAREENLELFVPLSMRMCCWAAFKNIRYEGISFSKIKERLSMFSKAECLQYMFHHPLSIQCINSNPVFLQRTFFRLTFRLLKNGKEGLLAAVFVLGYPLMKPAAERMVR